MSEILGTDMSVNYGWDKDALIEDLTKQLIWRYTCYIKSKESNKKIDKETKKLTHWILAHPRFLNEYDSDLMEEYLDMMLLVHELQEELPVLCYNCGRIARYISRRGEGNPFCGNCGEHPDGGDKRIQQDLVWEG